jgi:hypothetical protein
MKVTLERYYKSFTSLRALFAVVPFVPLLIYAAAPGSRITGFLYPPLSDFQNLAFAATVGFLLLTTFVVFIWAQLTRRIRSFVPVVLLIGFGVGIVALISLYVSYVRFIPVPSISAEVPVSVGSQLTDFAVQTYPKWSDWEMLHDRGPWEQQVQKLWTRHSIIVVRARLWAAYTLSLACFLSVVSLAAYQHARESASQ